MKNEKDADDLDQNSAAVYHPSGRKEYSICLFFFHLEDVVQKPLVKGSSFTPTVKVNALLNVKLITLRTDTHCICQNSIDHPFIIAMMPSRNTRVLIYTYYRKEVSFHQSSVSFKSHHNNGHTVAEASTSGQTWCLNQTSLTP